MRKRFLGVLVGIMMVTQLQLPVLAESPTPRETSTPDQRIDPPPVSADSEFIHVLPQAIDAEVELTGVYVAWNENLPIGLAGPRIDILGTDRMIMSGSYIDLAASADFVMEEDIERIEVVLNMYPPKDEIKVGLLLMDASGEAGVETSADLHFANDIMGVMYDAPDGDGTWSLASFPYVTIDGVEATEFGHVPNIGEYIGKDGLPHKLVTAVIPGVAQLEDGAHHLEATFRLYMFDQDDWEAYNHYRSGVEDDISGGEATLSPVGSKY